MSRRCQYSSFSVVLYNINPIIFALDRTLMYIVFGFSLFSGKADRDTLQILNSYDHFNAQSTHTCTRTQRHTCNEHQTHEIVCVTYCLFANSVPNLTFLPPGPAIPHLGVFAGLSSAAVVQQHSQRQKDSPSFPVSSSLSYYTDADQHHDQTRISSRTRG